jgi:hypothetical protein
MRLSIPALLVLSVALATPGLAKVLVDGKPSPGGFYWQKVENGAGTVSYTCRKQGVAQIQKAAACNGAKAVKP